MFMFNKNKCSDLPISACSGDSLVTSIVFEDSLNCYNQTQAVVFCTYMYNINFMLVLFEGNTYGNDFFPW